MLALAGAGQVKGHSSYAMCGAGTALCYRAALLPCKHSANDHETGWAGVRLEPVARGS